jgi:hypothetical protein
MEHVKVSFRCSPPAFVLGRDLGSLPAICYTQIR